MKKKYLIGLLTLAATAALMAGCSLAGQTKDGPAETEVHTQEEETEAENPEEQTEETEESAGESTEAEKSEASEETASDASEESLEMITVGEPYEVKTDAGTYSFTVTGVKHTDWMDDEKSEVITLCCEVTNHDYEPDDGSILMLAGNSFHLYDGDARLEEWDITMSEGGFPDFVEAGETKSQEIPYIAAKGISQVRVVFADKEVETAEVLCEVE